MKIEQNNYSKNFSSNLKNADLVLVFGERKKLNKKLLTNIKTHYPKADVTGCSSAGEILGTTVSDENIVITAIKFDKIKHKAVVLNAKNFKNSNELGVALTKKLPQKNLSHVLVFSDGQKVNGTELVNGIVSKLPKKVLVTGGLAGDDTRFKKTLVFLNENLASGNVVLIGLYGKIKVGCGSLGGWDEFGVERIITKSKGNVLYELDKKPALSLYKEYLGSQAKKLPASGLLFPLMIKSPDGKREVVRTILNIDSEKKSLIFAGDVPEGYSAKLMKANFDRLVDGAEGAAKNSTQKVKDPELAILVSCIGRKLVLEQRTEEEVEAVRDILGAKTRLVGFYAYGEICPTTPNASCELHNQTMTITVLKE